MVCDINEMIRVCFRIRSGTTCRCTTGSCGCRTRGRGSPRGGWSTPGRSRGSLRGGGPPPWRRPSSRSAAGGSRRRSRPSATASAPASSPPPAPAPPSPKASTSSPPPHPSKLSSWGNYHSISSIQHIYWYHFLDSLCVFYLFHRSIENSRSFLLRTISSDFYGFLKNTHRSVSSENFAKNLSH